MAVDCLHYSVQLIVCGLIRNKLLAMVLLLAASQPSFAQVASTALPTDLGSGGGVGTADLPGTSTPIGGVGTQEIPASDIAAFDVDEVAKPLVCEPQGKVETGKPVVLGAGNLTCTGPGKETVKKITGRNGSRNIVILQGGASLTVTEDVALDQEPGNGGTQNGNTITIDLESELRVEGRLTNHQDGGQGNPDVITNSGKLTAVGEADMYQFDDNFTNSGTATFANKLALGSGDDNLANSGELTIGANLNLKMGADTVTNSRIMTIEGSLSEVDQGTCGGGASSPQCGNSNSDSIVNSGLLTVRGDIVLGSGITQDKFKDWSDSDTINNSGTLSVTNINFEKTQATGADVDTLINSGSLTATGSIDFGRDGDTLRNTGSLSVAGDIDFGSGDDTFKTGYGFDVVGVIDGGSGGNDKLEFGESLPHYFDGSGSAKYGEVRAENFRNWSYGYQKGGNWDFDGDFSSNDGSGGSRIVVFVLEKGTFRSHDEDPPSFNIFEMDGGYIDFVKTRSDRPALRAKESFEYKSGSLYIDARYAGASPDNAPIWKVIEGAVINAEGLAENTFLVTSGGNRNQSSFEFTGLASDENLTNEGDKGTVAVYPFHYAYLASDSVGSAARASCEGGDCGKDFEVRLVPRQSPIVPDPEPDFCEVNPVDPLCSGTITPPPPKACEANPSADECKEKPPVKPPLIGCEDEELCSILPPDPDPDPDPDPEEEQSIEIIEIITEELDDPDPELDLPLIDYGQLARLIGSGLVPRNIDAAGRAMQSYNNLLADTLFERLPLRQFTLLQNTPTPEPAPQSEPAPQAQPEPIRGLWVSDQALATNTHAINEHADGSLSISTEPHLNLAQAPADDHSTDHVITINGRDYIEDTSLTAQYAERDSWRGWFRGFGGNNRAHSYTTLNNDYSLSAGGAVVGADVSLSDSFQLGFYANYGNLNVNQLGDTGGGSWNPNGWGGGITADYWTNNFYVQGLLGASAFSGTQNRGILSIADGWGDDTATANKSSTSMLGALRIGAPFQAGSLYLEPQLSATWSNNNESSFSESGVRKELRLAYGSRTTNYLQTALGIKLAYPINSGDRGQWVPNLKLAWLGDWDTGNGSQSIGYSFTNRSVAFNSNQSNQNGALIEAGLDYTIANINSTSFKVYAKGGAEIWGGDRGTTWRTSGGFTFQF
jgi:hypothetical protein